MIHSTAIVSKRAEIGQHVDIGPYTIIYDNSVIGDDTKIEGYCEIGYPTNKADGEYLVIGKNSLIRSHSIFYQGSIYGEGLVTGHHVTAREKIKAGNSLQIGTLSDFQGDCTIGNYLRTHSNVHIGKYSRIGDFVWLFPYVVLTNDPHPPSNVLLGVTVEDYAVIATMSIVIPGVNVGKHSLVGAHSLVKYNVLPHEVVAGVPAKKICDTSAIKLKDETKGNAYPWPRHFHRGYPEHIVNKWIEEYG
jgi:acetyltransferase-like isoleucine patch superfamily enzyme